MKTAHFTPKQIFKEFILPEIQQDLYNYIWVDMFAGTAFSQNQAQTTAFIQTFPILSLEENEKLIFKSLVDKKDAQAVIEFFSSAQT